MIVPGDVQRMTAGTGVRHSEFNHSKDSATHFLQIWIVPEHGGLAPGYEQVNVPDTAKRGKLALVGSPDKAPGASRSTPTRASSPACSTAPSARSCRCPPAG